MSKAEIEVAIREITETLKGPGPDNYYRLTLHEARKDLRKRLAKLEESA